MEKEIKLVQGNEACAEAAIAAGVRFFGGYPITPATEIAEVMAKRLPEVGGVFIQMEDEIGSISAVIGAAAGGAKAMTATSGPGLSMMQELVSSAIIMEIPMVIVNVQRVGPGLGAITGADMDMMQPRWGPHGGMPIIALTPASVEETYHLTVRAVNLSEKFRTPVYLLTDAGVGHMREKMVIPKPEDLEIVDRPRPTGPCDQYKCCEPDETGIPSMADYGTGYRQHHNSAIHDHYGMTAMSDNKMISYLIKRLNAKFDPYLDEIVQWEGKWLDDADIVVFAYGVVARSAEAAAQMAREQGIKAGVLRPITIWPFPDEAVRKVAEKAHTIIVAEMNTGQLYYEVERASHGQAKLDLLSRVDSLMITPQQVLERIMEASK